MKGSPKIKLEDEGGKKRSIMIDPLLNPPFPDPSPSPQVMIEPPTKRHSLFSGPVPLPGSSEDFGRRPVHSSLTGDLSPIQVETKQISGHTRVANVLEGKETVQERIKALAEEQRHLIIDDAALATRMRSLQQSQREIDLRVLLVDRNRGVITNKFNDIEMDLLSSRNNHIKISEKETELKRRLASLDESLIATRAQLTGAPAERALLESRLRQLQDEHQSIAAVALALAGLEQSKAEASATAELALTAKALTALQHTLSDTTKALTAADAELAVLASTAAAATVTAGTDVVGVVATNSVGQPQAPPATPSSASTATTISAPAVALESGNSISAESAEQKQRVEIEARCKVFRDMLAELSEDVRQKSAAGESLQQRLDSMKLEREQTKERLAVNKKHQEEANAAVHQAGQRVASLTELVKREEANRTDLVEKISRAAGIKSELNKRLVSLEENKESLSESLRGLSQEKAGLQKRLTAVKQGEGVLQIRIDDVNSQIKLLNERITILKDQEVAAASAAAPTPTAVATLASSPAAGTRSMPPSPTPARQAPTTENVQCLCDAGAVSGRLTVTAYLLMFEPSKGQSAAERLCVDIQDVQQSRVADSPPGGGVFEVHFKPMYRNRALFNEATGADDLVPNPKTVVRYRCDVTSRVGELAAAINSAVVQYPRLLDTPHTSRESIQQSTALSNALTDSPVLLPAAADIATDSKAAAQSQSYSRSMLAGFRDAAKRFKDTSIKKILELSGASTDPPAPPATPGGSASSSSASVLESPSPAGVSPTLSFGALKSPTQQFAQLDLREAEFDIEGQSEIVTDSQLKEIIKQTPARYRLFRWKRTFSITKNGASWLTFLHAVGRVFPPGSMLIVQDVNKKVFGGFAPDTWTVRSGYYGTGETFVFQFDPDFKHYHWTGANDFFMLCSTNTIALGGGDHFAVQLDSTFTKGTSGFCQTFDSPCLASANEFTCVLFEVWGPDGDVDSSHPNIKRLLHDLPMENE